MALWGRSIDLIAVKSCFCVFCLASIIGQLIKNLCTRAKDRKLKFEQAERRGGEEKGAELCVGVHCPLSNECTFIVIYFFPFFFVAWQAERGERHSRCLRYNNNDDDDQHKVSRRMIQKINIDSHLSRMREISSNQIDAIFYGYYPHIAWLLSSYHLALCIEVKY